MKATTRVSSPVQETEHHRHLFLFRLRLAASYKQTLERDGNSANLRKIPFLTYNKKWEFPRNRLELGRTLGSGAFGIVMEALAFDPIKEISCKVAVKMIKSQGQMQELKSLISELKILCHIGFHLNVVNLVGACTDRISKGELLVIVEYCRYGNLRQFLLRHRNHFIHQMDDGEDANNVKEITETEAVVDEPGHVLIESRNTAISELDVLQKEATTNQRTRVDFDRRNSTVSNFDEEIANNQSSYCTNEDLEPTRAITSRDLLNWSFQISRGMKYLASRKLLHGDLAARNVLLADNNIVKISDFGLSRDMYHYGDYKKKGDDPLPIKWMALESLLDKMFSPQSDVWSFGIVLWEIFSLGRTPYPGIEVEQLIKDLQIGYRLQQPEYANRFIYDLMQQCWKQDPQERPTFADLERQLDEQMEDSVKELYTRLDNLCVELENDEEKGVDYYMKMKLKSEILKSSIDTPIGCISHSLLPVSVNSSIVHNSEIQSDVSENQSNDVR